MYSFGMFSMVQLGQDPKIFITGNQAKDTDTQIESNESNDLLALLLLVQCKEERDENVVEI